MRYVHAVMALALAALALVLWFSTPLSEEDAATYWQQRQLAQSVEVIALVPKTGGEVAAYLIVRSDGTRSLAYTPPPDRPAMEVEPVRVLLDGETVVKESDLLISRVESVVLGILLSLLVIFLGLRLIAVFITGGLMLCIAVCGYYFVESALISTALVSVAASMAFALCAAYVLHAVLNLRVVRTSTWSPMVYIQGWYQE